MPVLFEVTGAQGVLDQEIGARTFQAQLYSGRSFTQDGEGGWIEDSATLFDFSRHEINLPTHNSGASMEYHPMVGGTILTPTFISREIAYLGLIPRLDFQCK